MLFTASRWNIKKGCAKSMTHPICIFSPVLPAIFLHSYLNRSSERTSASSAPMLRMAR